MSLPIEKSSQYYADVTKQFGWYFDKAGEDLAWRFFEAADQTLQKLSHYPDLGRPRKFQNSILQGLRSFPVVAPFHRFLIFYRVRSDRLEVWRLMHGARDLARRLAEPGGSE